MDPSALIFLSTSYFKLVIMSCEFYNKLAFYFILFSSLFNFSNSFIFYSVSDEILN
jgi:hypothetical protein